MIQTLTPPIKALILDMDGVLWRANEPIGDLAAIFRTIQKAGLKVILATNNATLSPEQYVIKLACFGVNLGVEQIVNSGMAVGYLLAQRFPGGGPIYIVGEEGLHIVLKQWGFFHAEKDVLAVVAAMDREVTYKKLAQATLLVRAGAPFYGTNPDRTFPVPAGLVPGAGAILAALETATDCTPVLGGKPSPAMMALAMDRIQTAPLETLAIGDRLETDILGGKNAGCRTALVLSGVATLSDLERSEFKPDIVASNLSDILGIQEPD